MDTLSERSAIHKTVAHVIKTIQDTPLVSGSLTEDVRSNLLLIYCIVFQIINIEVADNYRKHPCGVLNFMRI